MGNLDKISQSGFIKDIVFSKDNPTNNFDNEGSTKKQFKFI